MLHLVAYAITNLAAFLCLAAIYNATGREDMAGMAGIARRAPLVGLVMAVSMFSLAGLPIFAGFASKFYLFNAVAASGMLWLAGLAAVASLISLYYYLMIVRQMYIETPEDPTPIFVPKMTTIVLAVLLVSIVLVGVYPAPLMEAIQHASDVLLRSNSLAQNAAAVLP
jgi:NADH-quinone oxidoreductase subunit N